MRNFADQCLDLARSILGQNLDAINEDGSVLPVDGEASRLDEPGHAALAIGEFYRATQETTLEGKDLIDLAARCITAQAFDESTTENGLAYSALALLSFGPSQDRNPVWERLMDPTRALLEKRLVDKPDAKGHEHAFGIANAVTRFSMGLSKKDDAGKLIDDFLSAIKSNSSTGFCDDDPSDLGGVFDIYGILSFVLIRQALQLHCNVHLRERKLPSLRTHAEKYLKLLPEMVRADGLGWNYGRGIGAYGQMHCISLILQAMRDGWIGSDKKGQYTDVLRRLFFFFFVTYIDQERGCIMIRDGERSTIDRHTTRMANFDAARYLCQWARLARSIGGNMAPLPVPSKTGGRFISFDKCNKKEQGIFIYQDAHSGLHFTLPLVGPGKSLSSDSLAFPHCPGVFDWPVNEYLPIMLPELTFGEHVCVPSFYGKGCVTQLGARKSLKFCYDQPELITKDGQIISGLGSCKVTWTFEGGKLNSEFVFTVKSQITMDHMRMVLALGAPHSSYRIGTTFRLGEESVRAAVQQDDFQATWGETEIVTEDAKMRSYYGKIHYLQTLRRDHALIMHPGKKYILSVSYEPDIALADE